METPWGLKVSGQTEFLEPRDAASNLMSKVCFGSDKGPGVAGRRNLEQRIWMPMRDAHQLIKIPVKIPKSSLSLLTKTMLKQRGDDPEGILYLHI